MAKKIILHWDHFHRRNGGDSEWHMSPVSQTWVPNTDICEGPEMVVVRMELAGVPLENLEIALDEEVLVVRGFRDDPAVEETAAGYRFRQLEIQYGPFERVLHLPYPVDSEKTTARMRDGILEIRLPRMRSSGQTSINVIVEN